MDFDTKIKSLTCIEDLEYVDKILLADQRFIEKVLYKFGRYEDFSPDQIIDYASSELKENVDFVFSCFLNVINLKYSNNYLYSSHQEIVSYFFDSHVSSLLKKNEEGCLKLIQNYCGSSSLNSDDFLNDIRENNEMEWEGLNADTSENLKELLLRKTINATPFHRSKDFLKIIDVASWNILRYLPEQLRNNEEIYVYALKMNVKAKEFIPVEMLEKSDNIKAVLNDKNA